MDQELSTLKLNINQLAGITGVHRQTVAARLKQLEPALGSNNKLKLYLITDVLTELMAPVVASSAEDMTPSDRLAHWKAENERLKFEQDNTGRSTRRAKAAGDVPLYLLQTNALKDRINNALWRDVPGPNFVHFPDWLGGWFYDELTYEERSADGKWTKPGKGANEAFDLMVYAHALVILHGYEKIKWPDAPEWARRESYLVVEPSPDAPAVAPVPVAKPSVSEPKATKPARESAWSSSSGGWV